MRACPPPNAPGTEADDDRGRGARAPRDRGRALGLRPREARRAGDRPRLVAGAERPLRDAAAPRKGRPRREPAVVQSAKPDKQLYRISRAGGKRSLRGSKASSPARATPSSSSSSSGSSRRRTCCSSTSSSSARTPRCVLPCCVRSRRRTRIGVTTGSTGICSSTGSAARSSTSTGRTVWRARCARARGEAPARALACVVAAVGCGDARAATGSWVGTFRLPASRRAGRHLGAAARCARDGVHGLRPSGAHRRRGRAFAARTCASRCRACPRTSSSTGRRRAACSQARCRRVRCAARSGLRAAPRRCCRSSASTGAAPGAVVTVVRAHGFPAWLVELPSGRTHGIGPSPHRRRPARRHVRQRLDRARRSRGISWQGTHYDRVALRQREVRVGAIAATLTLPPGDGPFPAAVMVHGSGPASREEFQTFAAYLASQGVAVLAGDKRGIGQSTGTYPGERASESTIAVLARDAEARDPLRRGAAADRSRARRSLRRQPGGLDHPGRRGARARRALGAAARRPDRHRRASRTHGARSPARARGRRAARARRCSRRCARSARAASTRSPRSRSSTSRCSGSTATTTGTCRPSSASSRCRS